MTRISLRHLLCVSALAVSIDTAPALADQAAPLPAAGQKAKNVILFLADAAGVATLNGASLMGYGEPMKLRIQSWPHLGLSDTSPVDAFVSDSANGMSAIVTGVKTHNGVISQAADSVRGKKDGTPTKTIMEYAEERGLLTGVISTQAITDATPAANYAHANDRGKWGEIFPQLFSPRFGDGVDVVFGAGRQKIGEALAVQGTSFEQLSQRHGRAIHARLSDVPSTETRPIVVADTMDARAATLRAIELLSKSPNGYFLVVEWDAHTDDPRKGMQNLIDFDRLMGEVEQRVDLTDTLLLYTADHSFGLQVDGGRRGEDLMAGYDEWKAENNKDKTVRLKNMFINRSHTAEEVPTLAIGAGADRVRGYFPNTYLFDVMLNAWGWATDASGK